MTELGIVLLSVLLAGHGALWYKVGRLEGQVKDLKNNLNKG